MECEPGSTAFISSAQIYDLLTDEEKRLAENSFWEPAPHPFAWSSERRQRSKGLGVERGEVVPLDELPPWTPDKVFKYPLVWLNPVTGTKAFQCMPEIVHKIHFRDSPNAEAKILDDLEEIRLWLNGIYDRICEPEYILIPPCEEGDVVVWNNWVCTASL